MKIEKNIKKEDIKSPIERKNYSGVATFKVLAFNPSEAEVQRIKGNDKAKARKQVKFDKYNDGKKYTRLHFIVEVIPEVPSDSNTPIILDLEFDISNRDKVIQKQDGGNVYFFINDHILSEQIRTGDNEEEALNKITSNPKLEWYYSQAGLRLAKEGERELTMFMASLANYSSDDYKNTGIAFNDFNKLFEGDFSEIKDLLEGALKDGYFKALVYLELNNNTGEFQYMKVFNGFTTNFKAGNYLFERYFAESSYNKPRGYNENQHLSKIYYNPSLDFVEYSKLDLKASMEEPTEGITVTNNGTVVTDVPDVWA